MTVTEGTATANDVEFAYLEAGTGPLALCLHGFPDSAWTWRHLLPALADAGFRAVAPFMRGYAPTEVPADGRYQTGVLGLDACRLHEVLGGDGDAVIVGHDWGAMATYVAASHEPDRWRRVVAMAVPPAAAVASGFMSYRQLKRSWYMFFFQHPLADVVVGMNDLEFIDGLWDDWSPGYDGRADDLPRVKDALRDPANLQAALGYYRATLGGVGVDPALDQVQSAGNEVPPQPTLYVHGTTDGCMGIEVAEAARGLLTGESRMEVVEGAGHFLHVERPDEVNRLIVDFVTG